MVEKMADDDKPDSVVSVSLYDGPGVMYSADGRTINIKRMTITMKFKADEHGGPVAERRRWASDKHIGEARDIFEEYVCRSGFSVITD